jgi:phosphoribosylamine--glycine ligase
VNVLLVSKDGGGMGVAQRMALEGHDVAVHIGEERSKRAGRGILTRVGKWQGAVRNADLVIADCVGFGRFEDALRQTNKPLLGFCAVLDKAELDRAAGMEMFERAGIDTPETHYYNSPGEAAKIPDQHGWEPGWVIKPHGNKATATTAVVKEPELWDQAIEKSPNCPGICQRLVNGIEVSTEGWFNGRDWITPFNHTFEEKRFLAGNLGVNTGCMGNVVLNAGRGDRLVQATVMKMTPLLRMLDYRGAFDINTIVNEDGAYALEATSRMGYDAVEALLEGLEEPTGEFLLRVADGTARDMPLTADTMVAVRLSIPHWPVRHPNSDDFGEPITGINDQSLKHLWLNDIYRDGDDEYKTAGADGLLLKATAIGRVERGKRSPDGRTYKPDYTYEARRRVYRTLDRIGIAHKQYRIDIGERVNNEVAQLKKWGWLNV